MFVTLRIRNLLCLSSTLTIRTSLHIILCVPTLFIGATTSFVILRDWHLPVSTTPVTTIIITTLLTGFVLPDVVLPLTVRLIIITSLSGLIMVKLTGRICAITVKWVTGWKWKILNITIRNLCRMVNTINFTLLRIM